MHVNQKTWVDCATWRERWEIIKQLPSGGQGEAYQARRKIDGHEAFLKVIRAKTKPERRARFFREATAYDTIRVGGIPRLIESNTHRHENAASEPYLATDFIVGPTLRSWRESQTQVELEVAVATTRALLSTLSECHTKGCVHRDVKPDNIILAKGDPTRPMLLDFGLSFHNAPEIKLETEQGQEVGNRFLRLPELSAGSTIKQDPRSDLSFAAGIFFYMLTGLHPDVLQDAEGRLPHQRSKPLAILQNVSGVRFTRLASLFDNAFAPLIADRLTNADVILASIDRIMEYHETGRTEDDLSTILEFIDTSAARRRVDTIERLSTALSFVQDVHYDLRTSFKGRLIFSETGNIIKAEVGRNKIFWHRPGSDDRVMSATWEAREAGDEIIIRVSGETLYRTPIASPHYDEEFQHTLKRWLLAKIRLVITDQDVLPPEAGIFGERQPLALLSDAAVEAPESR